MDDQVVSAPASQDFGKIEEEIKNMVQGSPNAPQTAIDKFIETLIEEKGFTAISEEVRSDIRKDLASRIDEFMAARIITALSDDDVITFENMLKEGKSDEEIQTFVAGHIPDFVNFLTNVLLEFRNVYLGIVEAPRIVT